MCNYVCKMASKCGKGRGDLCQNLGVFCEKNLFFAICWAEEGAMSWKTATFASDKGDWKQLLFNNS